MTLRPPADAIVTLRGLGRRFRGVFAGLSDDESPDDLAHRAGSEGWSALDHIVHAASTIAAAGDALGLVLTESSPDVTVEPPTTASTGTVDERLDLLAWEADALADRIEHLGATEWARTDADGAAALDLLWVAVDRVIEDLRQSDRILHEVRGRP